MEPNREAPIDEFTALQLKKKSDMLKNNDSEHKKYCEVSLGGGHSNKGLEKYLKFDRKILSFDSIFENPQNKEVNRYKINYYLADDKIEVKEV